MKFSSLPLSLLLLSPSLSFHLPSPSSAPTLAALRSHGVNFSPSVKNGDRDSVFGPIDKYCADVSKVVRRTSRTVTAGPVKFGSDHPIVRQTMATTNTADVDATVEQIVKCADKGFDMVRITVQGKREANAAAKIREALFKKGYQIPLCADMHFQPKVSLLVADAVEKVRINPGNFADGQKDFDDHVYETEEDYTKEREYLARDFLPLVRKCKELNRAMRIGTNHGSLSSRVLSFYGDTPRGMVESAVEFADMCRAEDYHNFLFSMKASNPLVMVQGYRLLAAEMDRLKWDYPIHLGVTEAGDGEDGRMKSAIGIGTLLADGVGDTIRVSLTEDPDLEYDPCNRLAEIAETRLFVNASAKKQQEAVRPYKDTRDITSFSKRKSTLPGQLPADPIDIRGFLHRDGSVLQTVSPDMLLDENAQYLYQELGCKLAVGMPFKDIATTDSILMHTLPPSSATAQRKALNRLIDISMGVIVPAAELDKDPLNNAVALMTVAEAKSRQLPTGAIRMALQVDGTESDEDLAKLGSWDPLMVLNTVDKELSNLHASRRLFEALKAAGNEVPVVHHLVTPPEVKDKNELALRMGMTLGSLLTDGLGDGVLVEPEAAGAFTMGYMRTASFSLLQGCRMRNTKTEFVSCPSCGRTLFDLQSTSLRIQEATGHLPGVTVAVMGCIVNGPGEMADADFGYVGTVPGKVDLYVGKEVVKKGIPNEEAVDKLVELIKENDMWVEKEEEEEEQLVPA